ncbi:hypothetical protein ACFONL_10885 [Camelimonas fluminis]|uniref:Transposase n=1 Tax=Camelimonas fluminis TaxID=1576911 RepID=A0ABV7UIJ3_9HYPH
MIREAQTGVTHLFAGNAMRRSGFTKVWSIFKCSRSLIGAFSSRKAGLAFPENAPMSLAHRVLALRQ